MVHNSHQTHQNRLPRVLSVVGARPNFMKVAPLDRAFARLNAVKPILEHQIVHTGQHYDAAMSDAFFRDLAMPIPDYFLGVGSGSHAEQTARVMVEFEKVCHTAQPDLVIVVGDVNSTVACALTAKKLGIAVAHIEAGLRSFDRTMPEELNRLATDALCDYAFVTEQSGVENLVNEGWSTRRDALWLVGNTMIDSLHHALPVARSSLCLQEFGVQAGQYVLLTLHRPSNVDDKEQLVGLVDGVLGVLAEYNVDCVFPVHPRTRENMKTFGLMSRLVENSRIKLLEPQGYITFLALMMNARLVLTDSGGVQEETTVLSIPCLTLRTTTERPITCEIGTNTLVEPQPESIRRALHRALARPQQQTAIPPLWDGNAADRIASLVVERILPALVPDYHYHHLSSVS
jgi:UDP-N-acetylglucosamine 2-epimerase (non-hydrolysing)